ncbi:penicillin-binding protein [Pectinatus haikarae]|uniref:penicillin-binding protein n=1 Tax=Pectinatus haikarae TaxID=349096 RepID=UPI0038B26702
MSVLPKYSNADNRPSPRQAQSRIILIVVSLILAFVLLSLRYIWVQTILHPELLARVQYQAEDQYTVHLPRGSIYDRNNHELAVSNMTKSLYVDPNHVDDPQTLANDLAPLINMPAADILKKISIGGGFVWLKRQMEPAESDAAAKLIKEKSYGTCLGFREESKRYYPNKMLAANVLGFVGTDDKGLDGIEQSMDKVIQGQAVNTALFTDTLARPILDSVLSNVEPQGNSRKSVELTIDSTIQYITEQALDKAMAEYAPAAATAVVMDPKTAEILAMASRPSYDPNNFAAYSSASWKNKAVSFVYEPGSTFKAIVAAAALQEKIVGPNDIFVDPGYLMIDGRRIQNWSEGSFGTVSFTKIIEESINTGFVHIGLGLGGDRLMEYARKFGFGKKTGVELPGEEQGILFDPKDMSQINIATTSIGQSIAVTPLQMVTAMSAIANKGVLMKPHIIKKISNPDGSVYEETKPQEVRRAIDVQTDQVLTSLLEKVVSEGGGSKASVSGYRIAGKTGTAQKLDTVNGGYLSGRYIASFCGFAPVEDPQFVVLVILDDPHKVNYYGGQIAAPIAHDIFSAIFRYLHIEPSVPIKDDNAAVSAPKMQTSQQTSAANIPKGMTAVPDLSGKTIRDATQILKNLQLDITIIGSGTAASQSPASGTPVAPHTKITVHFSP